MALETATYIDDLQANWPANTDAVSAGDDHIRLIKKVLQNTFPYVTGAVGVSDVVLTRGAVPIGSVTVFYQAAAPTGWSRVNVANSRCLRVVPTGSSGGGSGGTDDPVVNAKVSAHNHAIDITSEVQNANHTHSLSGNTTGNESLHTHGLSAAVTHYSGEHAHYVNLTSGATATVSNSGNIPSGGSGGNAALTYPNVTHVHSVAGNTNTAGEHYHYLSGNTDAGAAHKHTLSGNTGNQSASHAHAISGNTATPTVTESGGTLGAWRPRYYDVIMCQRVS